MKPTIPIFFTIDDGYTTFMGIALHSIMQNASPDYDYRIHVIHQDLSAEHAAQLKAMEKENFSIELLQMQSTLQGIEDCEQNRLRCDYFTLTIYYRLFIAEMFPQYDKAIYIDSDVVVPGDISALYNLELGDNIVGACHDFSIEDVAPLVHYVENAVGIPIKEYVNSGVLLMNLRRMRELNFSEEFLTRLNTYHFSSIAPDQDYLNAMCYGHVLFLDECWDTMPQRGKPEADQPKLIHYNLFDKPWCYSDIPYQEYFWRYARETVFYDDAVRYLKEYSPEQIQRDRDSMDTMIQKALVIPEEEITFKKMYEKGERIRVCS